MNKPTSVRHAGDMQELAHGCGFRQLDHTADLAYEVWAPDEAALLRTAAQAVMARLLGDRTPRTNETHAVHVQALDADDRLVRWLNDVVALAMSGEFLMHDADVTLQGAGGLSAQLHGERLAGDADCDADWRPATELKAVTYHGVELTRTPEGCRARFIVDV